MKSFLLSSLLFTSYSFNNLQECKHIEQKQYGCIESIYRNGTLVKKIPYSNKKINGIIKTYYENGNLKGTISYQDGELNGISRLYYKSGRIQYEGTYKNNKEYGIEKIFFDDEYNNTQSESLYIDGQLKKRNLYIKHHKKYIQINLTYENNSIISGKCPNGKALSNTHLKEIAQRKITISLCDQ